MQVSFFLDIRVVNVTVLQLGWRVRHFVNWLFALQNGENELVIVDNAIFLLVISHIKESSPRCTLLSCFGLYTAVY